MRNAYKINLPNTMRIIIIDVTRKGVGKPNIWPTFIEHQWKPKKKKHHLSQYFKRSYARMIIKYNPLRGRDGFKLSLYFLTFGFK